MGMTGVPCARCCAAPAMRRLPAAEGLSMTFSATGRRLISASLKRPDRCERAELDAHLARGSAAGPATAFKSERRILRACRSATRRGPSARVRSGIESGLGSVVAPTGRPRGDQRRRSRLPWPGVGRAEPARPGRAGDRSPEATPPRSSASADDSAAPAEPPVASLPRAGDWLPIAQRRLLRGLGADLHQRRDRRSLDLGTVSGPPVPQPLSPDGTRLVITQKGRRGNEVRRAC
jgi:hypothetical protein